jgi:hypothetical protein
MYLIGTTKRDWKKEKEEKRSISWRVIGIVFRG